LIIVDSAMFHLAYYQFLYILVPLLCLAIAFRFFVSKSVVYKYSLATYIAQSGSQAIPYFKSIFFILRVVILGLLVFLICKPQLPDRRSKINVEGIDIMLVLDVSGSMICFDDQQDRTSRIEVAKKEVTRFVNQRETDAIGLTVFGNGALSACPLTHDKAVLREIVEQLNLGTMVDERSTLLSHGMIIALNRLKHSRSATKIMIVLTDGQPSMHDAPIHLPLSIAQKLGVKIYTIGVGSEDGGYSMGPHGMMLAEGVQLNEPLLQHIADQTGGAFYRARNAKEMRKIYDTIDRLEKQQMPVNLYSRYYDVFVPFLWVIILLVVLELLSAIFVWKTL